MLKTGYTYSGHPTSCAAGLANLAIMEREGLLGEAKRIGARLGDGLRALADDGIVDHARGDLGVWAAGMKPGQDAMKVRDRMLELGVITRAIGEHSLTFCPPLVITRRARSTASSTRWRRPPGSDVVQLFDKIDLSGRLTDEEYTDPYLRRPAPAASNCACTSAAISTHRRSARGCWSSSKGRDAGGKGGAIKRIVEPLDPRHYRVSTFAKPSFDEKRKHFLWRFWLEVPGLGGMALFDRSWYGRVLVERVEGYATKEQWKRAYEEIVQFERRPRTGGRDHRQVLGPDQRRGAAAAVPGPRRRIL